MEQRFTQKRQNKYGKPHLLTKVQKKTLKKETKK